MVYDKIHRAVAKIAYTIKEQYILLSYVALLIQRLDVCDTYLTIPP